MERRISLEVGSGDAPYSLNGGKEFCDQDVYVGIEGGNMDYLDERSKLILSARRKKAETKPGQNIYFIHGDGRELPFRDSSVHEVYIGNIFGTVDSKKWHLLQIDRIAQEARRVLMDDGRLIIKEDWNKDWLAPCSPDDLDELLTRVGFLTMFVEFGNSHFDNLDRIYGRQNSLGGPKEGDYYCLAVKIDWSLCRDAKWSTAAAIEIAPTPPNQP